jgi:hypothetical protein
MRHATALVALVATTSVSACSFIQLPGASRGARASTSSTPTSDDASASGVAIAPADAAAPAKPAKPDRTLKPGAAGYVDPGEPYGPVAAKRAGQVVFSSAPIARDAKDDRAALTTYKLGAPLHVSFFGDLVPHNLLPWCTQPTLAFRAEVNGEYAGQAPTGWQAFGGMDVMNTKERPAASLAGDLAVTTPSVWSLDREADSARTVRMFNADVVPKLVEGRNDVRVAVTMQCLAAKATDPVVAEGSIKIEVAAGGVTAYAKKFGTRLGKSPHQDNKKLVPQIIKATEAAVTRYTVLGAQVASSEWESIRHKVTGVVIEQRLTAALIVRLNGVTAPEQCVLETAVFRKDPADTTVRYRSSGTTTPFPCSNAPT